MFLFVRSWDKSRHFLGVNVVRRYDESRDKHGTCIRWYLRNRCAPREQSLLFDLFKAFDQIASSYNFFSPKSFFSSCSGNMF